MADIKAYSEVALRWSKKNISLLKGLGALLFGIALIYLSHRLILRLIVFFFGLLLIYYGLTELKLKKITNFIDKLVGKLKR